MHPLATALNATLERESPTAFRLLSRMGREAYFPVAGVLSQGADADGKTYNATIGIALEEDGAAMSLPSLRTHTDLPPDDVFPYVGAYGKKDLREAWRSAMQRKNPSLRAEVSLPVVTAGLTHALEIAAELFIDTGGEVLLPEPYWDNYDLTLGFQTGAAFRTFPLFAGEGFNLPGFRKLARDAEGKLVVFLNFPNNPTGYTPRTEEAEGIVAAVCEAADRGTDVLVILDDAYFGFVYEEGVERESLFVRFADLHERVVAVKVDGLSKEDCAWGLRIGFLTYAGKGMTPAGLRALEDKTAGRVRGSVSNCCHLSQSMMLRALASPTYEEEKAMKRALLSARYRKAKEILARPEFRRLFRLLPCNSGYFLCVELPAGFDAEEVRQLLLREFDTGIVALGSLIRIAFSSVPLAKLPRLFENVRQAVERISKIGA